jgi:hypothetical protein
MQSSSAQTSISPLGLQIGLYLQVVCCNQREYGPYEDVRAQFYRQYSQFWTYR